MSDKYLDEVKSLRAKVTAWRDFAEHLLEMDVMTPDGSNEAWCKRLLNDDGTSSTYELLDRLAAKDAEILALAVDNAILREALSVVAYTDQTRGYPMQKEWNQVVRTAKQALDIKRPGDGD
jgi:hypothetical protein